MKEMFLSVIIPAFNEEARLPTTLTTTLEYLQKQFPSDFEIIVVDDGSTDGTARIFNEFRSHHLECKSSILNYGGNRGKGFAVRYGMLRAAADWRLFCDADLATPVEEFEVVFGAMKASGNQIGIGSRPLRESHLMVRQPWYREMLGRSFNKAVRVLGDVHGISDTQCGFKIFSAAAAEEVFSRCKLDGFAFDVEALYIAGKLGYGISEVPIRWSHKDGSKVDLFRDGFKMLADVLTIRAMHRSVKALSTLGKLPL